MDFSRPNVHDQDRQIPKNPKVGQVSPIRANDPLPGGGGTSGLWAFLAPIDLLGGGGIVWQKIVDFFSFPLWSDMRTTTKMCPKAIIMCNLRLSKGLMSLSTTNVRRIPNWFKKSVDGPPPGGRGTQVGTSKQCGKYAVSRRHASHLFLIRFGSHPPMEAYTLG